MRAGASEAETVRVRSRRSALVLSCCLIISTCSCVLTSRIVAGISGGDIFASILNPTAAVTELLPMPPSEADGEGLSSQGESGGGGEGRLPSSRAPRRGTGSSAGPARRRAGAIRRKSMA